jgi:hypothetical protein
MSIGKLASGLKLEEGEGGRDRVSYFENVTACMRMHENAWVCKKIFFLGMQKGFNVMS